jgi:pyruvate/2-oxoglutarate dehydrogenase complex dihydrolipoamide acyltransferase (E2) component
MRTDVFTAVLNGQKVGMFGVGSSSEELAVSDDNSTTIRKMACLTLHMTTGLLVLL